MGVLERKVAVITGGIEVTDIATVTLFHREGTLVHPIDSDAPAAGAIPADLVVGEFTDVASCPAHVLAPRRFRVNTMNPEPVDNNFQNDIEVRTTALNPSQANAAFVSSKPLGRRAETQELAQGMLFLADPHSRMVTSTTLRIDGGTVG